MWTRLQYGLQSVRFWKTHIQSSKMLYTAELGTRPNCFDVLALPHHELKASLRFLYICWRITLHHFQICQKMFIRSYVQGWEFAHSLIAHSLICSFAHRSFAHLLKSLWSNERLAQIAQDKWATVSKSLRDLMTKERIARFFSESLFCSQKTSDSNKLHWLKFYFLKCFL